jgi:hypothetical protein
MVAAGDFTGRKKPNFGTAGASGNVRSAGSRGTYRCPPYPLLTGSAGDFCDFAQAAIRAVYLAMAGQGCPPPLPPLRYLHAPPHLNTLGFMGGVAPEMATAPTLARNGSSRMRSPGCSGCQPTPDTLGKTAAQEGGPKTPAHAGMPKTHGFSSTPRQGFSPPPRGQLHIAIGGTTSSGSRAFPLGFHCLGQGVDD